MRTAPPPRARFILNDLLVLRGLCGWLGVDDEERFAAVLRTEHTTRPGTAGRRRHR